MQDISMTALGFVMLSEVETSVCGSFMFTGYITSEYLKQFQLNL
jgi:hypothetical protein